MPILEIDLAVDFDGEPDFDRWAPIETADCLSANRLGTLVSMTFRLEDLSNVSREEVDRIMNVGLRRVHLHIQEEVNNDIASLIRATTKGGEGQYKELGNKLQDAAIWTLNRMIGFARAFKGQYWIELVRPDRDNPSQFFLRHGAKSTLDGVPVQFDPDRRVVHAVVTMPSQTSMITRSDWDEMKKFVAGNSRPPLAGSLIADARASATAGNLRSAVVEAATALEVALNSFARYASPRLLKRIAPELETKSVKALVDKLGFRGSFALAIPMLLVEEEFPRTTLSRCRTLIDLRNNVVHQGMRELQEKQVVQSIAAADQACGHLERASEMYHKALRNNP